MHLAARHSRHDDWAEGRQLLLLVNDKSSSLLLAHLNLHYLNLHIDKEHGRSISFTQCWVFVHTWLVVVVVFKPLSTQWKSNTERKSMFFLCFFCCCCWLQWLWGSIRVTWRSLLTPSWWRTDGFETFLPFTCNLRVNILTILSIVASSFNCHGKHDKDPACTRRDL